VQIFQRGGLAGFDGGLCRNAPGNLDVLSQQVIDQNLQTIGGTATFSAQVLRHIPVQVNGYLDFFDGDIKLALFGIRKIVFIFHFLTLFK
jgi:hypothetical protein